MKRATRRHFLQTGAIALLTLAMCSAPSSAQEKERAKAKPAPRHVVRLVYIVSADREENPAYTRAIAHAAKDLQRWYAAQLGGATFSLRESGVEVVKSSRKASWFYANPNGKNRDNWGYNNTLAEAKALVGAKQHDPHNVWVIYSDGPGNSGRGGNGVTCLPEDDLLGLIGKHPTQPDKNRWIAGLGHELGHAFGLPHPKDTKRHEHALMWSGIYGKYPDETYLTRPDKKQLWRSPFFSVTKINRSESLARYVHSRGVFERRRMASQTYWLEYDREGNVTYTFEEIANKKGVAVLYDRWRTMAISIPLAGGQSQISNDPTDAISYRPFYMFARE